MIADSRASSVHILSPAGQVAATLGGPGEGPGEFGRIGAVVELTGDTLLISDTDNLRVTYFVGGSYAYDRRFSFPPTDAYYEPIARAEDGEFVVMPTAFAFRSAQTETWRSYPVMRTTDLVAMDTIAVLEMFQSPEEGSFNPIRHFGPTVFAGGSVVHTRSDVSRVTWYDLEGRITQIATWDMAPRPLGDADWDAYEAGVRERAGPRADTDDFARQLDQQRRDFGGTRPLFRQAYGDADGNVWFNRYDFSGPWTRAMYVLSSTGEWLGLVEFPGPIRIVDIGDDRVLGVQLNELDVEALVVYPIDKTPS